MGDIRGTINSLFLERDAINKSIAERQDECPHIVCVCSANGSGGNWDRDDSYWYNFYCYDCRKSWSWAQDKGINGALLVKEIDRAEKPDAVELMIALEKVKKER